MTDQSPIVKRTFAGYTRYYWSAKLPREKRNEVVWVNKRYTPDDLRMSAPTQKRKLPSQQRPTSSLPNYWVSQPEAPLKSFSRALEEKEIHVSDPSSRCEEWSTLRQMLPSRGHCQYWHKKPPRWGSGSSAPPTWCSRKPKRYPHINSPMTK